MVNIIIGDYMPIEIEDEYLRNSELYQDLIEDYGEITDLPIYYSNSDMAYIFFEEILLPYYEGDTNIQYEFEDGIQYLQLALYIRDPILIDYIAYNLANYIKSMKVTNIIKKDKNSRNEILKLFESMPNESQYEILSKLTIKSLQHTVEQNIDMDWNWGRDGLSSNPAVSPDFVKKYIYKPWDWGDNGLSSNLSMVNVEFVEEFNNKAWNWGKYGFSSNPAITSEFVEHFINKDWNWEILSKNPGITPKFVEKYIDKPWEWGGHGLSLNINMAKIDFVKRYKDKNWNWGNRGFSFNKGLTDDFVEEFINKEWAWNIFGLSSNSSITPEFIDKHIDLPWNFDVLSRNTSIKPYLVEKYINKEWNWEQLSRNSSMVNINFVRKFKDKPWQWGSNGFSSNKGITIEFFNEFNNKPWSISWGLSENSAVTLNLIEKNITLGWNWEYLSLNPNITFDFIVNHFNKHWDWDELSKNHSITYAFIKYFNRKPWDYHELSKNPMTDILFNNLTDYFIFVLKLNY